MQQREGFGGVLRRELHLNALAYVIIVVLLVITSVLLFMVLGGIAPPETWLFNDHVFRTIFIGLLLAVILYMVDQHRRLRTELLRAHTQLKEAHSEIVAAYDRLAFAQHAAEVMTSLAQDDALEQVLRESVEHFGADAAAVVSDDVTLYADDGVEDATAHSAVLQVALDAVRAGKPIAISNSRNGSEALAVPLRIKGALTSVVCLWKRGEPFNADHLEGLDLLARIIELSSENQMLLKEVRTQLAGTLRMLACLIDGRVPDYSRRSARIAEHAVAVAERLGLDAREISDLRIAATLADVGMLEVPDSIVGAKRALTTEEFAEVRSHPEKGARVARNAAFSATVQEAIRDHHERLDGSGYPHRRSGLQIGLPARILAVADVFNSMTTARPHRPALSTENAVAELAKGAGTLYDRRVVDAFLGVIGYEFPERPPRFDADVTSEELARIVAGSVEVN